MFTLGRNFIERRLEKRMVEAVTSLIPNLIDKKINRFRQEHDYIPQDLLDNLIAHLTTELRKEGTRVRRFGKHSIARAQIKQAKKRFIISAILTTPIPFISAAMGYTSFSVISAFIAAPVATCSTWIGSFWGIEEAYLDRVKGGLNEKFDSITAEFFEQHPTIQSTHFTVLTTLPSPTNFEIHAPTTAQVVIDLAAIGTQVDSAQHHPEAMDNGLEQTRLNV